MSFIKCVFFFFYPYRQAKREAQRPCNYHQPSRRRNNAPRTEKLNFSFPRHSTRDAFLAYSVVLRTSTTTSAVSFSLPFPVSLFAIFHNVRPFLPTSPTPVIAIVKKNLLPGERKCDVPSYLCLIIITSFCRER